MKQRELERKIEDLKEQIWDLKTSNDFVRPYDIETLETNQDVFHPLLNRLLVDKFKVGKTYKINVNVEWVDGVLLEPVKLFYKGYFHAKFHVNNNKIVEITHIDNIKEKLWWWH